MSPLTAEEHAVAAQARELIGKTEAQLLALAHSLPPRKREIHRTPEQIARTGKPSLVAEVESPNYVTARIHEVLHDITRVRKFWDEWFDESRWGLPK